jgi:pre-rRNA-processing protein TSR3
MQFCAFSPERPGEFPGYVRLSVEGPALTAVDANSGILLIDGAWRHADRVQRHFSAIPSRSLQGFRTAYPRVSKLFQDPAAGLASVEALFVAYRILGRPTEGLLNHYYWREAFLRLNGWWPADGLSPQ